MQALALFLAIMICAAGMKGGMSTGGKIKRLQVGAPKYLVLDKLGNYDGYERVGDQEVYTYANKKRHTLSLFKKTNYYVAFKDGRLSGSGITDKVHKPKLGAGNTILFFDPVPKK
jgi:hypothetical protein